MLGLALDVRRTGLLAPRALASGVIGASMQCELSVALQLKVLHHFIEGFANGSTRRLKDPCAFGTPKAPKTLSVNPYQLPIHGPPFRCTQGCVTACLVHACPRRTQRSPFAWRT